MKPERAGILLAFALVMGFWALMVAALGIPGSAASSAPSSLLIATVWSWAYGPAIGRGLVAYFNAAKRSPGGSQ